MKLIFKMSTYENQKAKLARIASDAKKYFKNDLPKIRQIINDSAHILSSRIYDCYPPKRAEYLVNMLHSFAASLHP